MGVGQPPIAPPAYSMGVLWSRSPNAARGATPVARMGVVKVEPRAPRSGQLWTRGGAAPRRLPPDLRRQAHRATVNNRERWAG